MAYPSTLDTFVDPGASDNLDTAGVLHDVVHTKVHTAIEALEAKVGVDNSAVATSIDALLKAAAPPGIINAYGGATAPTGWLLCNGASQLRATYPALFAAIGTAYGSVDGTHFNVPNLCYDGSIGQGAMPLGVRSAGSGSVLADSGGSMDHTHNSHTLLGTHSSVGGHNHDPHNQFSDAVITGAGNRLAGPVSHNTEGAHTHDGHTGTHSAGNPPFLAVMYIIKT